MKNINQYVRTAKTVITANSPVLLLGTTIAGVVTTGVLAAKAGYKARGIVDDEITRRKIQENDFVEPSTQDIIKLTWLCYAVPAVTGASTIASAVGIHTIHTKRANAMAALYAVTSSKLDDYTDKAQELLGPKKTQDLKNDAAQRAVDRNPIENSEVIVTDFGTELCYDELSGRYFLSSMVKMQDAVNDLNRLLVTEGSASLNEWYDLVGLPPIPWGMQFGWNGVGKLEASYGATTASDGRSAISVWFQDSPKDNYGSANCP